MTRSQWHRLYDVEISAPAASIFDLISDLPNYGRWLPGSAAYAATTDVEPYPVRLGTRYHDGKPAEPGKEWWGRVTGYQPPASLDFQHSIGVRQLFAKIDVHIHYSLEPAGAGTLVSRWLVLDVVMPLVLRPARRAITAAFDRENQRTMSALKGYAEANA